MLFFLFACLSSKSPSTNSDVSLLSVDDVGVGIEEAVRGLLRVDPMLMHTGWSQSMLSLSDDNCPPMEEHNGMDLWRESCSTEDGNQFWGWSLYFKGHDIPSECCFFDQLHWLSGQAQIIDANGTTLRNFGDILHQEGRDQDGNFVLQGFVYGDFYWDSQQAENSWLLSDLSMEYYYTFTRTPSADIIDIQSWISYFHPQYAAAIFEDILFDSNICPDEPIQGEIWLRDTENIWYHVQYDSDTACDGCGTVFQNEQEIGQSCSNFDALFDWNDYPWENR